MITFAMNSDIPILKKIWKEIFHDEDWYLDDFFRTYFKEGKSCLIWKEDDKIVAMLHMIPYTYRICPHENKNAIYLYALATLEEYRGKGIMDALILEAFGSAGDSGEVSFLLIAISEVPAPISTSAIFNNLSFLGTTASIAAIGSNVRLDISRSTFSITV